MGALLLLTVFACGPDGRAPEAEFEPPAGTVDAVGGARVRTITKEELARQIRFATTDEAEKRRATVIDWIWGDRLPDAQPSVVENVPLPSGVTVDMDAVSRVDALHAEIGDTGIRAVSYLLHPASPKSDGERFIILHQGHVGVFDSGGLGRAASFLLRRGVSVIAMQMPLFGWNDSGRTRWRTHGAMFEGLDVEKFGRRLRIFLEPVVQNVTYVTAAAANLRTVGIAGISGGGWTASVAAAIDPRLNVSMDIAGSAPLYARTTRSDLGDREQHEESFFGEDIAADGTGGGIVTWLEIYVLGGHGEGRQAFQVNNEFDPCCFAAPIADSYAPTVRERVRALGAGEWTNVVDAGSNLHEVSEWTISSVLAPALGIDDAR
jgi:hypothetical protein